MMSYQSAPQVRLSVVASFLPYFFLENLVVRHDNSMLITVATRKELWYLPPPRPNAQVDPMLLHTFEELAAGIVELEPDVFIICSGNAYTTHENYLHRLDLRGWRPGQRVKPELIFAFPKRTLALNGCCALTPEIILAADCFAGLIWRVGFMPDGKVEARIWMQHESMAHVEDKLPPPPQPGVNGVRYAPKSNWLYYTSTGQKLFMRVRVNPETRDPASKPELVARGRMADDFCIDEEAAVAYVTGHRENTIDCVPLEPDGGPSRTIAGEPIDELLLGPSSAAWSRLPGEYGRVVYVTTDGGQTAPPPDGIVRSAKVLRMELL
jgi:hypothetical protein